MTTSDDLNNSNLSFQDDVVRDYKNSREDLQYALSVGDEELQEEERQLQEMLKQQQKQMAELKTSAPTMSYAKRIQDLQEEKDLEKLRMQQMTEKASMPINLPEKVERMDRPKNVATEDNDSDEAFLKEMEKRDRDIERMRRMVEEEDLKLEEIKERRRARDAELDAQLKKDEEEYEMMRSELDNQREKEREMLALLGEGAKAFQEWLPQRSSSSASIGAVAIDEDPNIKKRLQEIEAEIAQRDQEALTPSAPDDDGEESGQ